MLISGKSSKKVNVFIIAAIVLLVIMPKPVSAMGNCGYEGGISSGGSQNQTIVSLEYQEVCVLSGKPFILKGELSIRTTNRTNSIRKTYTYNLENLSMNATLKRTVVLETTTTEKSNGQAIEDTVLAAKPSEVVRIGDKTYTLKSHDMSISALVDKKPAIRYSAGNLWGKKTYQVSNGSSSGTVTVELIGNLYSYDQYWSTTETGIINYIVQSEEIKGDTTDRWGGTGTVTLCASSTKQMKYVENLPDQISFEGGYVETVYNNSILEYDFKMPEFDAEGISTDRIIGIKDTIKMESFPVQKRLPAPNLAHLRGHWAENDIKALFSLEVFSGDPASFNPAQYISRQEFVAALEKAAKEVADETANTRTSITSRNKTREEKVQSPFIDVMPGNPYFESIIKAYKRGLVNGKGYDVFAPEDFVSLADAITMFIRAVGLEIMAPNPGAVTLFKDNDRIPAYARNAVYIAQRIGLVQGDDRGYIHAEEYITKDKAAALINRFINYMRTGIQEDYRERIIDF